jgi:glycosyltransferase involved in cell wall biosynthesis
VVIGYVGRIVRDKGMHELAEAWRSLREQNPTLHLLLVGPMESMDPITPADMELFKTDPRVHLVGEIEIRRVAAYYSAMDIYVMPSYREGFGVSNIEAAAMELPVVSTRIPGCIDSVADGITGTLVPPRDKEALEIAIQKYIDDSQLRQTHGKAGRMRVLNEFPPIKIWEALHAEYSQLLHK